jgi:hypothetical protein
LLINISFINLMKIIYWMSMFFAWQSSDLMKIFFFLSIKVPIKLWIMFGNCHLSLYSGTSRQRLL